MSLVTKSLWGFLFTFADGTLKYGNYGNDEEKGRDGNGGGSRNRSGLGQGVCQSKSYHTPQRPMVEITDEEFDRTVAVFERRNPYPDGGRTDSA